MGRVAFRRGVEDTYHWSFLRMKNVEKCVLVIEGVQDNVFNLTTIIMSVLNFT